MRTPQLTEPLPLDMQPVTATAAAEILGRKRGTIGSWVTRYHVLVLGRIDQKTYYDLVDLTIIEREIRLHRPVPENWAGRRAIRHNY